MCCCSLKLCMGCALVPSSVVVLLAALLLPQLSPKRSCQPDAAGACKFTEGTGPVSCSEGVFLRLTQQPRIGLRHITIESDTAFARLVVGGCTVEFSLSCSDKSVQVREKQSCGGEHSQALGKEWEVCANGAELKLLVPVIDLSFDIEMEAGTLVVGCVTVSAPGQLPQLGEVRGSTAQQTKVLVALKMATGGCPTWRTAEDRLDRSWDYRPVFGLPFVFAERQTLKLSRQMAQEVKAGAVLKESGLLQVLTLIGVFATGGGHSAIGTLWTTVNCGRPSFLLLPTPGVSVVRHPEAKALIGDPTQRRGRLIGGGFSEVCFQKSLPIFLDAGSPEHTQVRRLWDASGLATMHEGELSDLTVPESSTLISLRKRLLAATVGLKTPLLDELGPVVARLFSEKLWGKRPSEEEATAIAAYASFGGLCIFSHLAARVPFLPGKIMAARAATLEFAKSSPVGQALVKEMKKPQYKELRELYAGGPKSPDDTALQNLADASLFAGLIGTSTMSMNCLAQMARGPQYVRMFRENSTAFLLEVMRTATAVGGSTQMLKQPWKVALNGEDLELPEGTYVTAVGGMAAGYDASVFPDPMKFDSSRPNLGETLNWNGLSKHVFARNYEGAPRFCPGARLSVKIAAKVCNHFSADFKAA